MNRNFGIPSRSHDEPYSASEIEAIVGRTERIEQVARDTTAWPWAWLEPRDEPPADRWPVLRCLAFIGAASLLLWAIAFGLPVLLGRGM